MQPDNDHERRLRSILRQALDREDGPDPTWDESPAARQVAKRGRRPSRWALRLLAVAALITAGVGSALLLGAPDDPPGGAPNGWIAYGMNPEEGGDQDIWFVSLDQEPRRVVGTDTDTLDQLCPAFSPDGRSLAYGEADRSAATPTNALVVAAVSGGAVSEVFRVDVPVTAPCPVWSPDGERIAFGIPQTSPGNPTQSAEGSEVWILNVAERTIVVLPDLLATDLEFSPDGSLLGVASGREYGGVYGNGLPDGRIHLYELASGTTRILESTAGAVSFTWSPDAGRIAYMTGDSQHELQLIDLATEEQRQLSRPFMAVHGIGPVWSPNGESIVFQRSYDGTEGHEVVLVWPDDLSAEGTPREESFRLIERSGDADGSDRSLEPYLKPYWVTWSPDGEYLLFTGWTSQIDPLLGVVPATPRGMLDVLVTDQDVATNPVYETGPFVPIQSWGRRTADGLTPTPVPDASTAEPSTAEPSPAEPSLAELSPLAADTRHVLLEETDSGVPVVVTIAAPLWNGEPGAGVLCWDDPAATCAGPPGGTGLVAFAGREYYVYEEACQWSITRPETPATTVDELIEALANQGSRAESAADEITVGGYAGMRILLPMHQVTVDSCDRGIAMFGLPGNDPARYIERRDLIEEIWAVDVDGVIVVLDGLYYPDTPQFVLDELRSILASATFGASEP